jgi:integrase
LAPSQKDFADLDFLPFARSTFAAKPKTLSYYANGIKSLSSFEKLARARLDAITGETIAAFVARRRDDGLKVSSINRELQVLRRVFHLAQEWGKVEKALPAVEMVPGEAHRERALTAAEEALYFRGAGTEAMDQHMDARLLADVARILLDCALRPEECFRLRPKNVSEGSIEIHFGKTSNARRRIPMPPTVQAIIDMRLSKATGKEWVFPATTKSGHIEPSTLQKQHARAMAESTRILREETGDPKRRFEAFELYTLRHTCLTRWAPHMDPWTLAYLAGHSNMNTTKRYIHPQGHTIRDAMQKAREVPSGHSFGHTAKSAETASESEAPAIN